MRHRSLMTAYAEGSIVTRELREMLSDDAASARFDRELARLDAQCGIRLGRHNHHYGELMHGDLKKAGAL